MFVVPPFADSEKMQVHRNLTSPDHANAQASQHQTSPVHANPLASQHQTSPDHGTSQDARRCAGVVSMVVQPCAQPSMGRKQHGPPEGGPC